MVKEEGQEFCEGAANGMAITSDAYPRRIHNASYWGPAVMRIMSKTVSRKGLEQRSVWRTRMPVCARMVMRTTQPETSKATGG